MPTHQVPGPLCASQLGTDWVDKGTLCLTRSTAPTLLGASHAAVGNASVEPSGAQWVARFPTGTSIADCAAPFRESLQAFVNALVAAGAKVNIAATRRPAERAYLMHWCWKLANGLAKPDQVPPHPAVAIGWAHRPMGTYSEAASLAAARAMVQAYGMSNLKVAPALRSHHIAGHAVDMSTTWSATLTVRNAQGVAFAISTLPRDGMNPQLHEVGKTYGVIKYHGGAKDRPHWSVDGR